MGARPIGCVLGLALPRLDEPWLAAFAEGFHALAAAHGCPLIGGDTTRSAHDLAISVTVFGAVPAGQALRRDAAQAGDDIWVSGELGAADVAYRLLDGQYPANDALLAATRAALEWPQPQVALGMALRGIAHAAVDLSDGLLQDLGHILAASRLGARLEVDRMPVAAAVAALDDAPRRRAVLGGGDVYQLCFTAPAAQREAVQAAARAASAQVTRVGQTLAQPGLQVLDGQGRPLTDLPGGFDHFPAA
jgi:thiamine-monophosphate kinase